MTRFGEECLGEFVIMLNTNCALMELKWRVNSNQARLAPSTRDSASYSERRCAPLVSLGASLEFTLRECNRRHIADPLFPKARRFLSREERHARPPSEPPPGIGGGGEEVNSHSPPSVGPEQTPRNRGADQVRICLRAATQRAWSPLLLGYLSLLV